MRIHTFELETTAMLLDDVHCSGGGAGGCTLLLYIYIYNFGEIAAKVMDRRKQIVFVSFLAGTVSCHVIQFLALFQIS